MKRLSVLLVMFACAGVIQAHDTETIEWNHTTYRVVLASEDTGKATSIFWSQTKAPGGPPMHVHDDADETFYVLEGRTRFVTILSPGGFEHFFAAVAAEGLTIPEDMPRISEIAAEFHLRFTGPPLPAQEASEQEADAAGR